MARSLRLTEDSRVAVIGGGPAGTYFALALFQLSRRLGRLPPRLVIFERKHFVDLGPRGCNSCAGVVQSCMLEKIERLQIALTPAVVQGEVRGYTYHTPAGRLRVAHQPSAFPIIATYRGGGPAHSSEGQHRSFDDHMLKVAAERGAQVIHGQVTNIALPERREAPVRITYDSEGQQATDEFDLVVCATGLNVKMMSLLEALGFGYRAPDTVKAFQAELAVSDEFLDATQGEIHVFGPYLPGLAFAAFIPKRGFLTLTMVGVRDINREDMLDFLQLPEVRAWLPAGWTLPTRTCMCQPRVAVSSARQPYTDRLVVIGDANCSRLYKSGIDSAYLTASFAARTVLEHGVDRDSLQQNFHARCVRHIVRDNVFGRLFFRLSDRMSRTPALAQAYVEVASGGGVASRLEQEILWGLFTGERPYAALFLKSLDPRLVVPLLLATMRAAIRQWLGGRR